jgi:hypothetical protein
MSQMISCLVQRPIQMGQQEADVGNAILSVFGVVSSHFLPTPKELALWKGIILQGTEGMSRAAVQLPVVYYARDGRRV